MIDTVVIHIPVFSQFTKKIGNKNMIIGDVADYGLSASTRYIARNPVTGEVTHGALYHPYESLPSWHSGIAVKFYDTAINCRLYHRI